ncbi:MAG: hypothetical protein ACI4U2_03310, partial [Christensenellaceae bacterium]
LVGCGANTPTGPVTGPDGVPTIKPDPVQDWGYTYSLGGEGDSVEFLTCELSPVAQKGYAMLTLFYHAEPEVNILESSIAFGSDCGAEIWQYVSTAGNQERSEQVNYGAQGILITMDEESFTFLVQTPDVIDWEKVDTEKTTVCPEDVRYIARFAVKVNEVNADGSTMWETYSLTFSYNHTGLLPWREEDIPWS